MSTILIKGLYAWRPEAVLELHTCRCLKERRQPAHASAGSLRSTDEVGATLNGVRDRYGIGTGQVRDRYGKPFFSFKGPVKFFLRKRNN